MAAGAAGLVAAAGIVAVLSRGGAASADAQAPPPTTAPVQRGRLSATVSQDGILTYRARPDGSPFVAVNRARGTYTALPAAGDRVRCGGVLYRVDDKPVLLLCGPVPAYRGLHVGEAGRDVRQLNRGLHVGGAAFTAKTKQALAALQRRRGQHADGSLALGEAVFLPEAVRIAKVAGRLGATARPGAPVLTATSRTLEVKVRLEPFEQGRVEPGDRAQVTLPGNTTLTGRVAGASIRLDHPGRARGLDRAAVQVQITTKGVEDALSVPVTALAGRAGGGFAVEVVRAGGRRALVAVRLGLFDDVAGRVQVAGDLRAGDRVVVPSL
jgi:hypothetical protein